ncbi:MAG: hypothetical protein VZQ83_06980 [Eubacterium sp.]|nr:hypothetical protein [Eubacterium sp.]
MIDKEKAERTVDKAVDFLNEKGQKAKEYAQEHELDQKVEAAAHTLEQGAMDIFEDIKTSFSNKKN